MLRQPVVLYDGECEFCRNWADRVRELDRHQALAIVPASERSRVPGVPFLEAAALSQAVHVVMPDGEVLVGGRAIPAILQRLPRWRWLAAVFRLPGTTRVAEEGYRWIARRRHRCR